MANKLPSIIDSADSLLLSDGSVIMLDSPKFLLWLDSSQSFRFDCGVGGKDGYTVRKEKTGYWYAYKRILGKLHKRYIGLSSEINMARLLEVADQLHNPQTTSKTKLHNQLPTEVAEVTQVTLMEMQEAIATLTRRIEQLEKGTVTPPANSESDQAQTQNRIDELERQNQFLKEENNRLNDEAVKLAEENRQLEAEIKQLKHQPLVAIPETLVEDFIKIKKKVGKQSQLYKEHRNKLAPFVAFCNETLKT